MGQPPLCEHGKRETYLKAEGSDRGENKRLKRLARRIIDVIRARDREDEIKSTHPGVSLWEEREQVCLRDKNKTKCKLKIKRYF